MACGISYKLSGKVLIRNVLLSSEHRSPFHRKKWSNITVKNWGKMSLMALPAPSPPLVQFVVLLEIIDRSIIACFAFLVADLGLLIEVLEFAV